MKNPAWQRDELILALDVYFRENYNKLGPNSQVVKELSQTLNSLPIFSNEVRALTFRNVDGVYMKLGNFLAIDPDDEREGLPRYGKLDEIVFYEFYQDRDKLHQLALTIRESVKDEETRTNISQVEGSEDESYSAREGAIILKLHKYRERDRSLVKKKKDSVLKKVGYLACEVCSFRYDQVYGPLGVGYIECHHTKPVYLMKPNESTYLTDLALVCANCHRMLHRDLALSLADLRRMLIQK
ncbi:hypothetical protein GCM10027341_09690 [Spirosoma knui]